MTVAWLGIVPPASAGQHAAAGHGVSLSTRQAPAPTADDATAEDATADDGAPRTVAQALEAGDLATARALATVQRQADPTAANFATEAAVLEKAGDFRGAAVAYRGQRDALPPDATAERAAVAKSIARVQDQARGTVADEPASTHRDALDAQWKPVAPKPKKKRAGAPVPPPADDAANDRVIDKWYFWVTLGAIVASAAAVTGIAIRASRQDQPDALGLQRAPTQGPTMLRF